jgi:hypothetical protein
LLDLQITLANIEPTHEKTYIFWISPKMKMGYHKMLEAAFRFIFLFQMSQFNCGMAQVIPNSSKDKRWGAIMCLELVVLFFSRQPGLLYPAYSAKEQAEPVFCTASQKC